MPMIKVKTMQMGTIQQSSDRLSPAYVISLNNISIYEFQILIICKRSVRCYKTYF